MAYQKFQPLRKFDFKVQEFYRPSHIRSTYYGSGRVLTMSEIGRAGSLRGMKANIYTRSSYIKATGQPKTFYYIPSRMYTKSEKYIGPSEFWKPLKITEYTKIAKPSRFFRSVESFAVERGLTPKPFKWLDITKLSDAKFMQKPKFSMMQEGLFYRGGYLTTRPTSSQYKPSQYGTDWLRSSRGIDVSIMPKAPIKTQTLIMTRPENPAEAFFVKKSELSSTDFSTGHVQPVTVMYGAKKGYTFGIVSGEQTVGGVSTKVHGISSGRYIGEIEPDVMVSRMYSRSLKAKMPTHARTIKIPGSTPSKHGTLTTSPEYSLLFGRRSFEGTTLSKQFYGGGQKISTGKIKFLSSDTSADVTIGFTSGRVGGVRTFDVFSVVKGRIKRFGKLGDTSEYYGDPGGFDYKLPTKMIDDIIMPGGISTDVGTKINLPSMFDPLSTKQISSVGYDTGVQVSSYWKDVMPVKSNIQSLQPMSMVDVMKGVGSLNLQSSVSSSIVKTIQANMNLNRNIQSQHLVPLSLSKSVSASLSAQESVSASITKQLQLQQQIQQTQLKQITITQPMSTHIPLPGVTTPYKPQTYRTIIERPPPPVEPTPPPPPPVIYFDLPSGKTKGRKKKTMDVYGKGYRFRRWKVPTMKQLIGINKEWM